MGTERENVTGGTFPVPEGQIKASDPGYESVVGPVFPYRGQEQHGVAVPAQPWLPQDGTAESWENRQDIPPDETEIKPVPVRIISEGASEIPSWRTGRHTTGPNPSQVCGRNDAQQEVLVRNISETETVFIGPDVNTSVWGGYPLESGAEVKIKTTEPIYAISTLPGELAFVISYTVVK